MSHSSGSPIRASGGPALAIGRTASGRPEQADVAEHVLAVLAAHDDEVLAGGIGHDGGRQVGDARVVIAPLGREQVDDRHALGPRLEQCRRRRDEVDMAVDGRPAGIVRVDALERQDQRRAVAADLDRPAERPVAEAVDDLDLDGPDRQRDREPPRDVRVGRIRRGPRRRRCPR